MNRINLLFTGLVFCLYSSAQDDWVLKKDKDDIVIYTRESADSPLKEYRASAIIKSPLPDVFRFLTDLNYRPAWVIKCAGLEIIDTLEEGGILYHTSYDIPWPLSDRDLVVVADIFYDKENRKARLLTNISDTEHPLQEGMVRMTRYKEDVFLEEIDSLHTEFKAEGFVDPGGSVPAWVVNMFLIDGIHDSVIRTRQEITKR